jgi:hypothetical protein
MGRCFENGKRAVERVFYGNEKGVQAKRGRKGGRWKRNKVIGVLMRRKRARESI